MTGHTMITTCVLCGTVTDGAIGATGLLWPNLCQRCKDIEDHKEEEYVGVVASAVDRVYEAIEDAADAD
jgi:hypothetical protein